MNITKYPNFHFIAHEAEIHSTQKQTLHPVYKSFSLGEHIFFGKQCLRLLSMYVTWHMCHTMTHVSCDDVCCMMTRVSYDDTCPVWWHMCRAMTHVPNDDNYTFFVLNFKEKKWTYESLFQYKTYNLNHLTFFEFLHIHNFFIKKMYSDSFKKAGHVCETNIMLKHTNTGNCSDFAVTGFLQSSQSVHKASFHPPPRRRQKQWQDSHNPEVTALTLPTRGPRM